MLKNLRIHLNFNIKQQEVKFLKLSLWNIQRLSKTNSIKEGNSKNKNIPVYVWMSLILHEYY